MEWFLLTGYLVPVKTMRCDVFMKDVSYIKRKINIRDLLKLVHSFNTRRRINSPFNTIFINLFSQIYYALYNESTITYTCLLAAGYLKPRVGICTLTVK